MVNFAGAGGNSFDEAFSLDAVTWFNRREGRAWGFAALAAALVCYGWLQVLPLLATGGTGIAGMASHQNDFKHIYLGSVLLSRDLSPYNAETMLTVAGDYSHNVDARFRTILPFVYLPFTGFVMRPLILIPFPQAVVAFQLINHFCILFGMWFVAWGIGRPRDPWALAALIALCTFNTVIFRQNNAGQLNAVLLFGTALLFVAIKRGWNDAAIGAIAAFLMLFKLSPGIFLIWFLLRKDWKRAAWMAAFAGAFTLITVAMYGFQRHLEFLPVLQQMGYGKSTWQNLGNTFWRDSYNQSFNALFHRLLVPYNNDITPWINGTPALANGLTWVASIGVLGALAFVATRKNAPLAASFSAAVCASLLIPAIMWDHYLVQLLLPLAIMAAECVRQKKWGFVAALAAAWVIMALPITLDQLAFRAGPGLLLMSGKLVPVLICFAIACLMARERETGRHEA